MCPGLSDIVLEIYLQNVGATRRFGRALSSALAMAPSPIPIFFHGTLGAGKTTLISALVTALPGGNEAETSSPSFTLCNLYDTKPPVVHFDLYRQESASADESLLDFLDGERHLVLVEWAERLPEYALPPDRLACAIETDGNGRILRLTPYGHVAATVVANLCGAGKSW